MSAYPAIASHADHADPSGEAIGRSAERLDRAGAGGSDE